MSLPEADFRRLHFQSPTNPDRQWIDWFCDEFSRQNYGVQTTPLGDGPMVIAGVTRLLPDLAVYRGTTSLVRSVNTPALATSDDPFLMICLSGGDLNISFSGNEAIQSPGSCFLGSEDRSGVLEAPQKTEILSIRLRRKLLELLVPGLSDRLSRLAAPNSQALRLLLNYVQMLDSEQEISSAELRVAVTAHVHELAALVVKSDGGDGPLPEEQGVRAGRLAAIKADIVDHLTDPRLSVGFVAARQGITPRYLHMLFAADGVSFTEFVLDHRLARAHRMLTDLRYAHLEIGAIALHVGFNELSYFNRAFRRRYHGTPSDVRAASRADG
jgi:AraC-like DNA-binding protein